MAGQSKLRSSKIIGTGAYVPVRVLTNEEIERTVPGASAVWTADKLGILERRIVADDETTGSIALNAARRALANAKLAPTDLDLIIVATVTPNRPAPATACWVQRELGANEIPAFDLIAVCSGFVYALSVGAQFIATGAYRHVLVIGADVFSRITDWTRRDCVFFGDGAGAAVLAPCDVGEGLLSFDLGADGVGDAGWSIPAGGSEMPITEQVVRERLQFWKMDGPAVWDMAVMRMPQTLNRALNKAGLAVGDVDYVIPHQPSVRMLHAVARAAGVPIERVHVNVDRFANTSGATVALALAEANCAGKLQPGKVIALLTAGAGWTWGAMIFRWTH